MDIPSRPTNDIVSKSIGLLADNFDIPESDIIEHLASVNLLSNRLGRDNGLVGSFKSYSNKKLLSMYKLLAIFLRDRRRRSPCRLRELEKTEQEIVDILTGASLVTKGILSKYKPNNPAPRAGNNETFGITIEYLLAELFDIPTPSHMERRIGYLYDDIGLKEKLGEALASYKLKLKSFVGSKNGECDFILENDKTLSVKTNINGDKVCPQNIGQIAKKRFCELMMDSRVELSNKEIKSYIIDNVKSLFWRYLNNLLCCDYLLWVYVERGEYSVSLFSRESVKKKKLYVSNFTFSRSLDEWVESSTLKYEGESIGEFQIHQNRDAVKFRFKLKSLQKLFIFN